MFDFGPSYCHFVSPSIAVLQHVAAALGPQERVRDFAVTAVLSADIGVHPHAVGVLEDHRPAVELVAVDRCRGTSAARPAPRQTAVAAVLAQCHDALSRLCTSCCAPLVAGEPLEVVPVPELGLHLVVLGPVARGRCLGPAHVGRLDGDDLADGTVVHPLHGLVHAQGRTASKGR